MSAVSTIDLINSTITVATIMMNGKNKITRMIIVNMFMAPSLYTNTYCITRATTLSHWFHCVKGKKQLGKLYSV